MNSVEQIITFYVGKDLLGLEVMKVQEVTKQSHITSVQLAPEFVYGLINLRGQIATALGLNTLFKNNNTDVNKDQMSVVCRLDGNLVSLIVDSIGDVIEIDKKHFEQPPKTLSSELKKYIKGVYKLNGQLLSILDLDSISKELSPSADSGTAVLGQNKEIQ